MIEALIGDDWQRLGVKVLWRIRHESGPVVYTNGPVQQVVQDNAEVDLEPLFLTGDMARSLLTALVRYYDGGEDTRSLRKDYDAERKRVDLVLNFLTKNDLS